MPLFIEQLTGITNEMLAGAPPAERIMGEVLRFTSGFPLVPSFAGCKLGIAHVSVSSWRNMSRYVFFNSDAQDDKVLTAAEKVARSHGATVVKSLAGTMLLEVTPTQVTEVAHALPGWRYSIERKTTRVPERKSLERFRARARGTAAAAAKG